MSKGSHFTETPVAARAAMTRPCDMTQRQSSPRRLLRVSELAQLLHITEGWVSKNRRDLAARHGYGRPCRAWAGVRLIVNNQG